MHMKDKLPQTLNYHSILGKDGGVCETNRLLGNNRLEMVSCLFPCDWPFDVGLCKRGCR